MKSIKPSLGGIYSLSLMKEVVIQPLLYKTGPAGAEMFSVPFQTGNKIAGRVASP